jgi:serine/threonine protein kinase
MAMESINSGQNVINRYKTSRFKTLQVLGAGSFGEVSLAEDVKTGRNLVIKKMKKNPTNSRRSFEDMGTELVALRHLKSVCREHLVCYDGFFEDEDNYYITTEYLGKDMITLASYIDGRQQQKERDAILNEEKERNAEQKGDVKELRKLHQEIEREAQITNDRTIKIARSLKDSLSAIHKAGIAHRDLKPDNILVSRQTGDVRYIDFGLACWDGECDRSFTIGTQWYSAPELMSAPLKLGSAAPGWTLDRFKRSDVYSLGLTIFELFTNEPIYLMWRKNEGGATPEKFARDFRFGMYWDNLRSEATGAQNLFSSHGINLARMLNRDPEERPIL